MSIHIMLSIIRYLLFSTVCKDKWKIVLCINQINFRPLKIKNIFDIICFFNKSYNCLLQLSLFLINNYLNKLVIMNTNQYDMRVLEVISVNNVETIVIDHIKYCVKQLNNRLNNFTQLCSTTSRNSFKKKNTLAHCFRGQNYADKFLIKNFTYFINHKTTCFNFNLIQFQFLTHKKFLVCYLTIKPHVSIKLNVCIYKNMFQNALYKL